MEDERQADRLQSYVILAKGARGRAVCDLITRVTADPAVFGFGELLACSSIKDLQQGELAQHLDLLKVFAYHDWPYYKAHAEQLPALSDAQAVKLKQLTVISLALKTKVLPYCLLMECLEVSSLRHLEDFLITQCFYPGIVHGKLNQKEQCMLVRSVVGRDVHPDELPQVAQRLADWVSRCAEVMTLVEQRVAASAAAAEAAAKEKAAFHTKLEELKAVVKADKAPEAMLLDEPFNDLLEERDDRMERDLGRFPVAGRKSSSRRR